MSRYRVVAAMAVLLGAAAPVAVGFFASRRISQLSDEVRLVERTREVIGRVQDVLAGAVDAETGMRGFAITGDDAFLAPYTQGRARMEQDLGRLRALVAGDLRQASRVEELTEVIARRTAALEEAIERRKSSGFDAARQLVQMYDGMRLMDEARAIAASLRQSEQETLEARQSQTAAGFGRMRLIAVAGTAGAVLALLLVGAQITGELRKRRLAEASVRAAYEEVESRVKDRTRALEDALEQLKISEDQFRVVTELSPVYLFRTDAEGGCEFFSASFFSFTGLSPERSSGFGWASAVVPEDRENLLNAWRAAISEGRPFGAECRFQSKEGEPRWLRIRVVPRLPEGGAPIQSWIGAAVDIHELKDALATRAMALARSQQAQRESEAANQLKDEFLATASHELRTPLNAIVGWAHMLKLGDLAEQERRHAIDAIERNAKAQTRLIEDLLDVSAMIQGRFNIAVSPVDLRSAVREAVVTMSPAVHARHIRLDVQIHDQALIIDGDPNRLQQVAWNLLSNAVKFTTNGGEVRVRVDRVGSRARIRVEDSGEGIDPAFLPHVFEAFRQAPSVTMRSGLGLGLAIVHRLVELHGGSIAAHSAGIGRGASFVVTFPLHRGAHVTDRLAGGGRPQGLKGVKVLIAEDDDDSSAALTAVLRLRGCQVRATRSASECLQLLPEWHPDILLLDLGLPDDDGLSLLRRARSVPGYGDVPAIALTAFAGESDRVRALAAGFKAHVPKPFDPDIVVREISSAMPPRA